MPAPAPVSSPEKTQVFPARVEGKKLYVKIPHNLFDQSPTKGEHVYDWAGPDGAHHATFELSSSTMVYTVRIECKLFIWDEAGNLLGEVIEEQWA
jgi:hypothetical protein